MTQDYLVKTLKYVRAARPLVAGTYQSLRKDTARALQRKGFITHKDLSTSGLGVCWELTNEGLAALGIWEGK